MRFARTLPSLLLLAFVLLFSVAPGCGAGPEPPAAEQLRRSFPAQAAAVLDRREAFAAAEGGSFRRAADEPSAPVGGLQAALPQLGRDVIALHVPASDFAIRVREGDASGEGVLAGGAVAYERRNGSSFWAATEDGVEEWLLLDAGVARAGSVVASWEIEGGAVRQDGEVILIDDAAGVPRVRVTAPAAFGAGGRPVKARLAAHGATIDLTVDADGEAALVDPLWVSTGSMSTPRFQATATVLPGGKVLAAGGSNGAATLASCEIYDPATNVWTLTGSMATARNGHAAVLLGNGKVLVTGGNGGLAAAELFDPAAGTWTTGGTMTGTRLSHAMALVGPGNSKVLVAGGLYNGTLSAAADLYDPLTNTWAAAAPMSVVRRSFTLTLLGTNKVLAAGGSSSLGTSVTTAELYTAGTNTWGPTGAMTAAREAHTATLLPSGKVIVVAGLNQFTAMTGQVLATTSVYDPAAGTWFTGGNLAKFRQDHATVLLPNGGVLVIGGSGSEASVEFYDAAANAWSNAGPLLTGRGYHFAAPLASGKVLVGGGYSSAYLASAELYTPYVVATACASNGECLSGFCVDGVCCSTACNGLCQACSAAKTGGVNGTCGSVTAATDPDNECTAQAASTCTTNGFCNGSGACQLYVSGTSCAAASCSGSTLTNASTCDGVGTCVPGGTQSCGAYLCAGATCPTTCTLPTDCTVGNLCIGNKCVAPLGIGSVCTASSQCASGFCADGFCCNSACNGLCQACSALKTGGANGACVGVAAATDPDNECATQAASTCGTSGACNGTNACQQYAAGTTCVAPSCSGSTLDNGSSCNGTGTCTANGTQSCAPYQCGVGAACKLVCVVDTDCTAGNLCIGGKCGSPLPDGSLCLTAGQCNSGNCVDGVCCNTACSAGACDACSVLAGAVTDGVCAMLTGNACDDGDVCTQADTCMAGTCSPGIVVQCVAIDACHTAGVCDPKTGCSNPAAADGTACVDKNGCTQNDTCQQGKCVGGPVCPAPDACSVGSCNALGTCDYAPVVDGTSCDDGNLCTPTDTCTAGVCGGTPIPCAMADNCHEAGSCDPKTGACAAGMEIIPTCPIDAECETVIKACEAASGACVKSAKPDGAPCNGTGQCLAGSCLGGMGTSTGAGTGSASTGSAGTGSASTGSASTGSAGTASTGSGEGGSGSTSSAASGVTGSGGSPGDGTVSPAGGCGCSTVGTTSESRAPWLLLGLLLVVKRRRRDRAA
jgi:MYXO-CTERM domain-containing protein